MIQLTKLDNSKIFINVDMIQSLQATPDTVITFTTKEKIVVKEPIEEVSNRILEYQRFIHNPAASPPLDGKENQYMQDHATAFNHS